MYADKKHADDFSLSHLAMNRDFHLAAAAAAAATAFTFRLRTIAVVVHYDQFVHDIHLLSYRRCLWIQVKEMLNSRRP